MDKRYYVNRKDYLQLIHPPKSRPKESVTGIYYGFDPLDHIRNGQPTVFKNITKYFSQNYSSLPVAVKLYKDTGRLGTKMRNFPNQTAVSDNIVQPFRVQNVDRITTFKNEKPTSPYAMIIQLPKETLRADAFSITLELEAFKSNAELDGDLVDSIQCETTNSKTIYTGAITLPSDTDISDLNNLPLYLIDSDEKILNPNLNVSYKALIQPQNNKSGNSDAKIRIQIERLPYKDVRKSDDEESPSFDGVTSNVAPTQKICPCEKCDNLDCLKNARKQQKQSNDTPNEIPQENESNLIDYDNFTNRNKQNSSYYPYKKTNLKNTPEVSSIPKRLPAHQHDIPSKISVDDMSYSEDESYNTDMQRQSDQINENYCRYNLQAQKLRNKPPPKSKIPKLQKKKNKNQTCSCENENCFPKTKHKIKSKSSDTSVKSKESSCGLLSRKKSSHSSGSNHRIRRLKKTYYTTPHKPLYPIRSSDSLIFKRMKPRGSKHIICSCEDCDNSRSCDKPTTCSPRFPCSNEKGISTSGNNDNSENCSNKKDMSNQTSQRNNKYPDGNVRFVSDKSTYFCDQYLPFRRVVENSWTPLNIYRHECDINNKSFQTSFHECAAKKVGCNLIEKASSEIAFQDFEAQTLDKPVACTITKKDCANQTVLQKSLSTESVLSMDYSKINDKGIGNIYNSNYRQHIGCVQPRYPVFRGRHSKHNISFKRYSNASQMNNQTCKTCTKIDQSELNNTVSEDEKLLNDVCLCSDIYSFEKDRKCICEDCSYYTNRNYEPNVELSDENSQRYCYCENVIKKPVEEKLECRCQRNSNTSSPPERSVQSFSPGNQESEDENFFWSRSVSNTNNDEGAPTQYISQSNFFTSYNTIYNRNQLSEIAQPNENNLSSTVTLKISGVIDVCDFDANQKSNMQNSAKGQFFSIFTYIFKNYLAKIFIHIEIVKVNLLKSIVVNKNYKHISLLIIKNTVFI